jgi:ketosteroid isomerase-like protein
VQRAARVARAISRSHAAHDKWRLRQGAGRGKTMTMDEFEVRLVAAYRSWHASRGRAPEGFFALYAENIELHSILEASLTDLMTGPFIGRSAAIRYFAAIAEAWEMVEARLDDVVVRGDKAVCVGYAAWKNLRTLRTISGPKVDVWTVRDGMAVHFLEMFDSYGCARALGIVDPLPET